MGNGMTITCQLSEDGAKLTIAIEGRFDFSAHRLFRDAYELQEKTVARYEVDMSEASYLDSSALGMLLLLRDFAGGNDANIEITHCNEDVFKIFSIANFEQLFSISQI